MMNDDNLADEQFQDLQKALGQSLVGATYHMRQMNKSNDPIAIEAHAQAITANLSYYRELLGTLIRLKDNA